MGYVLGICDDCGNIDYDYKFSYLDEDNKKVCENKELCQIFDNVINRRYTVFIISMLCLILDISVGGLIRQNCF